MITYPPSIFHTSKKMVAKLTSLKLRAVKEYTSNPFFPFSSCRDNKLTIIYFCCPKICIHRAQSITPPGRCLSCAAPSGDCSRRPPRTRSRYLQMRHGQHPQEPETSSRNFNNNKVLQAFRGCSQQPVVKQYNIHFRWKSNGTLDNIHYVHIYGRL